MNQFPLLFEFNSRYLLCIADNIYDCRFGTFLCNCEKERKEWGIAQRTASLWDYLEVARAEFLNPFYEAGGLAAESEMVYVPISCILRRVTLWSSYHLRYSSKPSLAIRTRFADRQKDENFRVDSSVPTFSSLEEDFRQLHLGLENELETVRK